MIIFIAKHAVRANDEREYTERHLRREVRGLFLQKVKRCCFLDVSECMVDRTVDSCDGHAAIRCKCPGLLLSEHRFLCDFVTHQRVERIVGKDLQRLVAHHTKEFIDAARFLIIAKST